jgi:hypothetical protein
MRPTSGGNAMHRRFPLLAAVAAAAVFMAGPGAGQAPAPSPKPAAQTAAPPQPYKSVAVTLPASNMDPGLDAFRKQLADAAKRKDRAALARLVVPKGFFWQREDGNVADDTKSGIDNLVVAMNLGDKDGPGWEVLAEYASDETTSPLSDQQNLICSPADPTFSEADLEAVAAATQTDPSDWGYLLTDGVEVRDSALPDAKVIEKLGLHFVRVMPDTTPLASVSSLLRIVTPSGKVGYIPVAAIAPLGNDQLCYAKDGDGWKIAGYVGEGAQQ